MPGEFPSPPSSFSLIHSSPAKRFKRNTIPLRPISGNEKNAGEFLNIFLHIFSGGKSFFFFFFSPTCRLFITKIIKTLTFSWHAYLLILFFPAINIFSFPLFFGCAFFYPADNPSSCDVIPKLKRGEMLKKITAFYSRASPSPFRENDLSRNLKFRPCKNSTNENILCIAKCESCIIAIGGVKRFMAYHPFLLCFPYNQAKFFLENKSF